MNIITKPSVYLVGKQLLQQAELDRFLADHGATGWTTDATAAGDALAETGGRMCYQSWKNPRPGGNAAYLQHIKEVGHGSIAEHAVWTFVFTGVSRSLLAELTRHRAGWSYSVLSQRYVDESVAEYVEPDIIAADPELHALWVETVERTHAAYVMLADKLNAKLSNTIGLCNNPNCFEGWQADQLPAVSVACPTCKRHHMGAFYPAPLGRFLNLDQYGTTDATTRRKTARQAARSVLPNATETKIQTTANARALRHFLEQRGSRHAEPEIRKLANAMLDILAAESPALFSDYTRTPLPDGTFEITTPFPKV